jgi:hypothetical protein
VEYFSQIHLRNATGSVLRVVITLDIDHQAFKDTLELAFDFDKQLFQLTGLQERGYVVIGMETLLRLLDSGPDS